MNDGYFFIANDRVPEIWVNLKKDVEGKLVLSDLVLGHELLHVLAREVPRLADPDRRYTVLDQPQPRPGLKKKKESDPQAGRP